MLWADARDEFLVEKSLNTAPRTQEFYATILKWFQRGTAIQDLDELCPSIVQQWLLTLRDRSEETQRTYRRGLCAFTRWLVRRRLILSDPFDSLDKPRRPRKKNPPVYSPIDCRKLLEEAARGRTPERDIALLLTFMDTGIRAGELANLELRDIDWQTRVMQVDGKTGQRLVPFSLKLNSKLQRYVRSYRIAQLGEPHVFTTEQGNGMRAEGLSLLVRRLALKAGITGKKLGPHTLRHTFAVSYIRAGGDAFSLQRILGHSTMEMTAVYVNMNTTDLRQAHARFSPLQSMNL